MDDRSKAEAAIFAAAVRRNNHRPTRARCRALQYRFASGAPPAMTAAVAPRTGTSNTGTVRVGIVMGSRSDWDTMQHAASRLESLGIAHEVQVVSAHRTPDLLFRYAEEAASRGLRAIIAGAGGAAHLPGMLAAKTAVPVLGVPVQSKALNGLDSLLSIVQMPAGVPVATFAIGQAGAANAALFAAAMLAADDAAVRDALAAFRDKQTADVLAAADPRA
jgi:5-(carboxyamino)imidazole ribonucleotide mutase